MFTGSVSHINKTHTVYFEGSVRFRYGLIPSSLRTSTVSSEAGLGTGVVLTLSIKQRKKSLRLTTSGCGFLPFSSLPTQPAKLSVSFTRQMVFQGQRAVMHFLLLLMNHKSSHKTEANEGQNVFC